MKQFILIALFIPIALIGQERLVLTNNVFINLENDVFLVIDNSNDDAITTIGAGGNIISENETDVVKWNVSNNTGSYVIPWATASSVKIPQTLDITIPGSSGGHLILSTYETATDFNVAYPSTVTNMNYNGVDRSLFVVDRFWHTDASSYAVEPSGRMILAYDPAPNELGGSNTITETNLLAQRFNTGVSHWESYNLPGTNDAGNDRVTNIGFVPGDFYQDWILVDQSNPLPVTLSSFEVLCDKNQKTINWVTSSEINNAYFLLEKSLDGTNFFELDRVRGAGNSSISISYSYVDDEPSNVPNYYRLTQVDHDGGTTIFPLRTANCKLQNDFLEGKFMNRKIVLNYSAIDPAEISVELYDVQGRLIVKQLIFPDQGLNALNLSNDIAKGLYVLSLTHKNMRQTFKLTN